MRKIFTSLFLICCTFMIRAQYVINADAAYLGGTEYQLTKELLSQGGSVWYQVRLDLRYNFEINADLNLGRLDAGGADGIAFVLQPLNVNQGGIGGGIGYFGITPSFAIEFDTWQNPDRNDPPQDHMAFMRNGNITHGSAENPALPFLLPNIEDGVYHPARFTWNAAAHTLTVQYHGMTHSHTEDLTNTVFGSVPYVYWGFTGATGAAINDQRVMIGATSFVEEINIPGRVNNTTCPGSADGSVDISPTGGVPPYSFVWSNGATTEDLSGVPAGNYSVTVTDNAGVSQSASFIVGTDPDALAPTLTCPAPAAFCFNSTGQYFVSPLVVTDNCDPAPAVSYVITGATNRTGTGKNAAGSFSPGSSTITWTAMDASGNTSTCSTLVTVDPQITAIIPDVFAVTPGGAANTIYIGYGPSSLTLQVLPSGGIAPYTFSWSTGSHAQTTAVSFALPGTYLVQVKVTDATGCLVLFSKTIKVVDVRCGNKLDKVTVCHIPPGNPGNPQTICISPNAVPAHLSEHGDALGSCDMIEESEITRRQIDRLPSVIGIYPNPTRGRFEIQLAPQNSGPAQLTIMNANGNIVERKTIQLHNAQSLKFDLGNKPAGVYLVKIVTAFGIQTQKVVVQR